MTSMIKQTMADEAKREQNKKEQEKLRMQMRAAAQAQSEPVYQNVSYAQPVPQANVPIQQPVKTKQITKTQAIARLRTYKICAGFLPTEQRKMRRVGDNLLDDHNIKNVSPEEIVHAAVSYFWTLPLDKQAELIEKDRAEIGKDKQENDIPGFLFN